MPASSFVALATSVALVVVACSDGSVHRYAACTAADACPSSTTCIASIAQGPTFCTSACKSNTDCPNDDTGARGICTSNVGPTPTPTPFCYEACRASGCPAGSECASVIATDSSFVTVCIVGLASPLSGTTWTSATIATQGKNASVTASTYAMTFGVGEFSSDTITVTGPFTATFTQTFGTPSSSVYAGCTETTTFTGGTWSTTAAAPDAGKLLVTGAVGTTTRVGCTSATENTTGLTGVYDAVMDASVGSPFSVQGSTMTLTGGGSALPYSDKVPWSFTKT